MLKWKRNKCGGSHPEGLDRIDSATRAQSHRTLSLRETQAPSSPRAIHRKKNDLFTRSFCESENKKAERLATSFSETDMPSYLQQKKLHLLMTEYSRLPVNPSPFENITLEDICDTFDKAHEEMISSIPSPSEEGCSDIFIVAPTKSRQNSRQDRQCSPTALPCIEEGVENDELASIADSGICDDEEYDLTDRQKQQKRYFEPLKFHEERLNSELSGKNSPVDNQECMSPIDNDMDDSINKNEIETKYKNKMHPSFDSDESELTTSHDSMSSIENSGSFGTTDEDDSNSSSNLSDIDAKNNQTFSRLKLKADLTGGIHDAPVPHSLM